MNAPSYICNSHISSSIKLGNDPRLRWIVALGYHHDIVSIFLHLGVDTRFPIEIDIIIR
jgi:hypothetical protein